MYPIIQLKYTKLRNTFSLLKCRKKKLSGNIVISISQEKKKNGIYKFTSIEMLSRVI